MRREGSLSSQFFFAASAALQLPERLLVMLGAAFGVAPAVEGLGETESDAKDLLRSTISATVNKVCLDRYLEEYRKRREQAETIVGKEISLL